MQFGRDIVFTYGPLGFLIAPYCLEQPPGAVILANALLCLQVAGGLVLLAWRLGRTWGWLLLAIFAFESANVETRADLVLEAGFLCWGLLSLLESGAGQKLCAASFVLLATFAAFAKVTYLFMAGFSICAIAGYAAAGRKLRLGSAVLLCFAGAFVLGWLACGQELSNIGSFLRNSLPISREYDQAASLEGLPMLRWMGVLVGLLALATVVAAICNFRHSLAPSETIRPTILLAWLIGVLFLVWKHSMVRLDRYHFVDLMVFAPMLTLGLEALPGALTKLRSAARLSALVCCVVSIGTLQFAFFPNVKQSLAEPFRQFAHHLGWVLSPEHNRSELEPALKERIREAQLPQLKRLIGANTVDVFGSLQAYALLNGLNYQPRPVFQSEAAYSPELEALNVQFYLSGKAPEFVLFELSAPDHHFRILEEAPASLVVLINYEKISAEGPFLLLKRKSGEAVKLDLLHQGILTAGQRIRPSQYSRTNVWLDLEVEPTFPGRLMRFFCRPSALRLSVWEDQTGKLKLLARHRVAPSALRSGFLACPFPVDAKEVNDLYSGRSEFRPVDFSVEPDPSVKNLWSSQIRFRVYHLENDFGRENR
jgi:hypothetical protein